jgi:sporulation protein YlmC with PRC-barrel domain
MPSDQDRLLAMGDIMDMQLETSDGRHVGRVADIEAELREDGTLALTHLVVGPEALSGRVASRLRPLAHRLLRGRFDHRIPLAEIEEVGPTVRLRGTAEEYGLDRSDRWLAEHILRFIPGSK